MDKPVRVNDVVDLDRLPFPAAYMATKTEDNREVTTTSTAYVIKATESMYLVSCTAAMQHAGINGPTTLQQVLATRTPVEMRDKFSGFEFIPAELRFSTVCDKA